ncbi:(2Fe-2S)-binding protein [Marinicella sp. W31]|uniref:(2Fe-2S)-binding protein n=1 Tax=Marinicella sp. W31 TaxID=3023713 RepID=UPI0037579DB9
MSITLKINNKEHTVEVEGDTPLLWVLRDNLKMQGTKFGCGMAQCGNCTVHLNGQPIRSCVTPVSAVSGQTITTIEGIAKNGKLHAVQQAWLDHDVVQCGYCQSGQIMSAVALLEQKPNPTDNDIESFMAGNICRCGTYPRIKLAIKAAAKNSGSV